MLPPQRKAFEPYINYYERYDSSILTLYIYFPILLSPSPPFFFSCLVPKWVMREKAC